MYRVNALKEFSAAVFENGEIFLAVANIYVDEKLIEWAIPKYIMEGFSEFVKNNTIIDFDDNKLLEKYSDWFIRTLNLENDSLNITISVNYMANDILFDVEDNNIKYNQTDMLNNCVENEYTKWYNDKEQKAFAYILEDRIVSIAFDNRNGTISVETLKEHWNKGYVTKCLKKLLNEYKRMNKPVYYPTTLDNKASMKLAEKCGMKLRNYGYWVRIKSKEAFKDKEIIGEIIKGRK
jgi:predicted acetyltransferase